uniref:hypothetical protein n=1 Tax=Agathobacter sp. TaxID=2021311 RepID=UPI0040576DAF
MENNTNYNPYGNEESEAANVMEKSAFAQYVTAGAAMESPHMAKMGIKEFRRTYDGDGFKKKILIAAVIAYVLIAFNIIMSILFNIIGLIDSAILAALVIGMHKNKSKGCVIGLLAYSLINWLVVFIGSGNPLGGWIWIAISVFAFVMFNKVDKAYKQMFCR